MERTNINFVFRISGNGTRCMSGIPQVGLELHAAEQRRMALQAAWDAVHDRSQRNRVGQFATPFPLACDIVQEALSAVPSHASIRFIEPALGTGAFYSALLHKLQSHELRSATGFENDGQLVRQARPIWKPLGLKICHADFTQRPPPHERSRFDLLLANPPYVRHHHLTMAQKQQLRAAVHRRLGISISGLCGLYGYFLLLAHEWLKHRAVAAWLVPAEMLDVNYGASLRQYLSTRVRIVRVHRFPARATQFKDALVSSCVVILQNEPPCAGDFVHLSEGEQLTCPARDRRLRIGQLQSLIKWRIPEKRRAARSRPTTTLGDMFAVRRGVATGDNSFFILPRYQALDEGLPDEYLTPILPGARCLPEDVIYADDDGWPVLKEPLALLDCALEETVIRQRYPRLWKRLQGGITSGVAARYLCRHRRPWYRQEQRSPAPYLCTYMGRGTNGGSPFRILWNQSRAIAANTYLLLYPRSEYFGRSLLSLERARHVLNLLHTCVLPHASLSARLYGGGLHKLEPSELKSVPVREA